MFDENMNMKNSLELVLVKDSFEMIKMVENRAWLLLVLHSLFAAAAVDTVVD